MRNEEGFLKNLIIWSYARGTIQYDIICILILEFIFFVPPSCFVKNENAAATQSMLQNTPSGSIVGKTTPHAQPGLNSQADPIPAP